MDRISGLMGFGAGAGNRNASGQSGPRSRAELATIGDYARWSASRWSDWYSVSDYPYSLCNETGLGCTNRPAPVVMFGDFAIPWLAD